MIINLVSVRDQLNGFGAPLCEVSVDTAKRNFAYAMNNNDMMGFTPKDYDLYVVGTFDSEQGIIASMAIPRLICRGSDVMECE